MLGFVGACRGMTGSRNDIDPAELQQLVGGATRTVGGQWPQPTIRRPSRIRCKSTHHLTSTSATYAHDLQCPDVDELLVPPPSSDPDLHNPGGTGPRSDHDGMPLPAAASSSVRAETLIRSSTAKMEHNESRARYLSVAAHIHLVACTMQARCRRH